MPEDRLIDLYELLPSFYKLKDAEQNYMLRSILNIISDQANLLKNDMDGLWDDLFIETCSDWAVPYIADLVGTNFLHQTGLSSKADVAKTIYYRRRKGTLSMLEELARDITGWGAHAVAFMELLSWTQNLNHLRFTGSYEPGNMDPHSFDCVGTVNMRNKDALDLLDGPFDIVSHSIDIRNISRNEGWYGIKKLGFFLWRLNSYPIGMIGRQEEERKDDLIRPRPSSVCSYGYHFNVLGIPSPLFNNPEADIDEAGMASELNVPGPIRALSFQLRPEDYYGSDKSFFLVKGGGPLPLAAISPQDLTQWRRPLGGKKVAIDVRLGRISFSEGDEPQEGEMGVYYNYGFSADMGGGPYERRMTLASPDPSEVNAGEYYIAESLAGNLQSALEDWESSGRSRGLITITDNGTCEDKITIKIQKGRSLAIQAANQRRPSFRIPYPGLIKVEGSEDFEGEGSEKSSLSLNGLLIEGGLHIRGSLDELNLQHCTLVPGRRLGEDGLCPLPEMPSIVVEDNRSHLRLFIDHSICGALRLPSEMDGLEIYDSIVDCASKSKATSRLVSALISGKVDLSEIESPPLRIEVTVGMDGPCEVILATLPGDLENAASLLEKAIKKASREEAFSSLKVAVAGNRLILISEVGKIIVKPYGGDTTASVLKLTPEFSTTRSGLLSDELPLNGIIFSKNNPSIMAMVGSCSEELTLQKADPYPKTLQELGKILQEFLNALEGEAFEGSIVTVVDKRLVLIPGREGVCIYLSPTEDDKTTIMELGMESDWPAIASINDPFHPGPRTILERTTVFGSIRVKELELASDCIITGMTTVDRSQTGCTRFSYVSEGSNTPRRYHCQPDLALANLDEKWIGHPGSPSKEDRQKAINAMLPAFASLHYGQPAYAQLSRNCPDEIKRGAEDGSEMGAFCSLKQPQREDNLRTRLEEYMPFGLEGGFIFIN